MDGLKSHLMSHRTINNNAAYNSSRPHSQSASLLHVDYGRSLRPNIMACDALYSLNELFTVAIVSESQLLNLISSKLDKFFDNEGTQNFDSLPNLEYFKQILYRHIQYIQHSMHSIRGTKVRRWPKAGAENEMSLKAKAAAEALERDLEHNLDQAKMLHTRCKDAITILMSATSIAESQKAMVQAERLGKLTFLAFIFVPLGFTTSFFGMNLRELDGNKLHIWTWFLVSVPVLALTLFTFFFTLKDLQNYVHRQRVKHFPSSKKEQVNEY